ncbi:MAG: ComF family protein [Clostridia bacterium]|nr:ComF family protein [Clostridia bacterium]
MIFPTKCAVCGRIAEKHICAKCNLNLKKLYRGKTEKIQNRYYEEIFYLYEYRGNIKRIMLDFKFKDKGYLGDFFFELIKTNKKLYDFFEKYDIVIPVPVHYYRKIKRGYNQSELIIRDIERICNLKLEKNILVRLKNLKQQSKLSRVDRQKNIKNVYTIKNIDKIKDKNIIIFDDIYTTGSTVNECSRILKQNGAKSIGVCTIMRA